jgi:putative acetyltransferase
MITIRPERPEDVGAIRAINEAAFGGSAEADIVDTLRFACPDVLSLVALSGETVVGHIFFSPVQVEAGLRILRK